MQFKYGKELINLQVPQSAEVLEAKDPLKAVDENCLKNSLKKLLSRGGRSLEKVGIVVSDKTRLCGYDQYLPALLEILHKQGVPKSQIQFFIAYGTHPVQDEKECIQSYGYLYKDYSFIHHDCNDLSLFTELGTTSRGTPVRLRKDLLECSCIITFGAISHHYFAGYGGGRKLIFPGLGEKKAIYHNHSLFLNFKEKKLEEGCAPGNIINNPVYDDLREYSGHFPPIIAIHAILNSKGDVCQLPIGKNDSDFRDSCALHDSYFRKRLDTRYDMVVASGGGYPKDINLIQSHKSMHNAAAIVKDGGKLLLLTECIDGIGNDQFLPLFKFREAELFEQLKKEYSGNGGTALALMAKAKRIEIHMHTALSDDVCQKLGVIKTTPDEMNRLLMSNQGNMAVIPNASMLVCR